MTIGIFNALGEWAFEPRHYSIYNPGGEGRDIAIYLSPQRQLGSYRESLPSLSVNNIGGIQCCIAGTPTSLPGGGSTGN